MRTRRMRENSRKEEEEEEEEAKQYNRDFKQIATAGAATATESKVVKKRVIAYVSCSHPAGFSSPEPVVSWSRGLETRGSGSSRPKDVQKFRSCGHACAEVTNITAHAHNGFLSLTAPLGEKLYFLSSLQRVASLGCFENTDFYQPGFTDNLELKGEVINKNQLNTLLECRTETINRQIIV